MGESRDRFYHDQVDPITADKRDRVIPRSNLRRVVIALDVAGNDMPFRLRGDFLYADNNSTGVVTCKLNNTSEDPFPLLAQAGLAEMPFEDIYLTWSAQAGKVLNLFYGYKARFASPSQNIATIGSITNPVNVQGPRAMLGASLVTDQPVLIEDVGGLYGTTFTNLGSQAANSALAILAAASNPNGYFLRDAVFRCSTASSIAVATMLAKASAPASPFDGNIILAGETYVINGARFDLQAAMRRKGVRVPSGQRLDYIPDTLENALCQKFASYTVY